MRSCVCVVCAAAAIALSSTWAAADEKDVCLNASEQAQVLRDQQRLLLARAQLLVCARDVCPAVVRKDCDEVLADVMHRMPSIVVRATGERGEDVADAVVVIDGQRVAGHLDGKPITLDPGERTLHVETSEGRAVEQQIVLAQGEHERLFTVNLRGAPSASAKGSGQRIAGIVIGVSGLAGIAVGGVFGALALGDKNTQVTDCASNAQCPNPTGAAGAHNDAVTTGTVSTIAFIAGGALLVTGVVLLFTAPSKHLTVGWTGLGAVMRGEF